MPRRGTAIMLAHAGRTALRFERLLPHPPERVWRALCEPNELSSWHPSPFDIVGSVVRYRAAGEEPAMPDGKLLALDPPLLLAYTWGDDELRFELEARAGGCLLRLTHVFDDRFKAARDAAGWDLCLDGLKRALAGNAPDGATRAGAGADTATHGADGGSHPPADWPALNHEYEQRFGISPEQATPPPSR